MLSINDTRHQCSICPRSYKRPEHLRRHQDAHDAGRIYTCQSCSTSFHRSDVLKRHSQTCRDRKAQASHRRRACERCVRQKKACDTGAPCSTCTSRHEICSNRAPEQTLCGSFSQTHAEHVPGHSSPEIPHSLSEFTDVGEEGLHFPTSPFEFALIPGMLDCTVPIDIFSMDRFDDRRGSERPSSLITRPQTLDFLARFTSKTGLISSFDCGTLKQRQDVLSVITDGDKEPVLGVTDLLEPSTSAASPTPAIADSLLWRTHEILLLAKEVTTIKPRNSIVDLAWSAVVEKMCSQFFSPCNLRKYLEFFWSIWHPNVNFIHRPTFSPAECKVTLLASMVLLGACVSPEQADQQNASMWFNVVEEMVFSDPDLSRDLSFIDHTPFDHIRDHKNIQALQAAYNVCLCQNWEGTDASRQRIRRYRFSTMVSAARDIGIYNAQHRGRLMQGYIFRWERFVAEEELIRVFLWIFLLDTAFVIFNNLPPRMLIKEAKIHMACPESCFQADTAGECQQQLQLLHHTGGLAPELLLRTAVKDLCNANLAQARMDAFANLGPLNLFVLASGMGPVPT